MIKKYRHVMDEMLIRLEQSRFALKTLKQSKSIENFGRYQSDLQRQFNALDEAHPNLDEQLSIPQYDELIEEVDRHFYRFCSKSHITQEPMVNRHVGEDGTISWSIARDSKIF
jgi:hypothetical protein